MIWRWIVQWFCAHRYENRGGGFDWSTQVCSKCGLRSDSLGKHYGRDAR